MTRRRQLVTAAGSHGGSTTSGRLRWGAYPLASCGGCARPRTHNLQADSQNRPPQRVGKEGEGRTLLSLPRLVIRLGGKAEVGHLGALGEKSADSRIVRHGDRHASRSSADPGLGEVNTLRGRRR